MSDSLPKPGRSARRAALYGAGAALVLAAVASAPVRAADAQFPSADAVEEQWDMLGTYCTECHNFEDWAGSVAFDIMSPDEVPQDAEIWEEAVRKLRGGLMPPPGETRPSAEEIDAFVLAMEAHLDAAAAAQGPAPGHVGLHRLNRKEYANAVRDLLGVEVDAAAILPQDNSLGGFDNIAEVLSVSPAFMEQYVSAAREVALTAIGNGHANPSAATYVNSGDKGSFKRHVEGLPLGTRGGLAATHYFAADGEYQLNIADMAGALWVYNMEYENPVVVTLDGVPIYETTVGGDGDQKAIDQYGIGAADQINQRLKNITFRTTAGPHEVGVAFLERTFAESDARLQSGAPGGGQDTIMRIASFEVRGPFNPTGVSPSAPRQKIFTCLPESAADERSCAEDVVSGLARRAYRRPVTDADMAPLMAFYERAAAEGGFDAGVRQATTAILASPEFLFRYAAPPESAAPGDLYALSDLELASRLSFFLWSSVPDDALLDAAEAGELSDPDVLEAQVRRMLADPRAQTLVTDFAFQWLEMNKLEEVVPDPALFPNASGGSDPRDAYRRELELFIGDVIRNDRPVPEMLTADYTYLNEQAGFMYGMTDIRGDQFRKVTLTDPARFGLLGKGAVLLSTSYPNRTGPVIRGKFVLENILGAPPAPPPPGVDTDLTESEETEKPLTIRERLAAHRADPSCNSCHGVMDPLGLALENFNAVGEWRSKDRFAGQVIDASGELPDGTRLNGPVDLRDALMARPEQFVRTFAEELMTFALGRTLTADDMPAVRGIVRDAAKDDYRVSAIVRGVAQSDAFRKMRVPSEDDGRVQEASAASD